MITTENTQGINVITLVNFEKYNGVSEGNPPNNPPSNPHNELINNDLQGFITHLVTKQVTQYLKNTGKGQNLQLTSNPNKKKEEYIELTDVSSLSLSQKKENTPNGVSKKDKLSSPSLSEKVDYNGLMDYYNATFKDKLQQIKSMTDVRKKAVKARIAQYGKESIRTAFNLVLQSSFLLGGNDRNWKCDFDWIFKQANFTKILEGNYNGKRTDTATTRRESVSRLKDLAGAILQGTDTKNG